MVLSSPIEIDGRLVAMGGSANAELRHGTRSISTYDFVTSTWMECERAQLPVPLYRPGVVKLEDDRVMILGGQIKSQNFSATVFIGIAITL